MNGRETFAGYARTVLCAEVYTIDDELYAIEIETLYSVLPNEVLVVSTGKSLCNALAANCSRQ